MKASSNDFIYEPEYNARYTEYLENSSKDTSKTNIHNAKSAEQALIGGRQVKMYNIIVRQSMRRDNEQQ